MDRGAWWATIYGVATRQARLWDWALLMAQSTCMQRGCSPYGWLLLRTSRTRRYGAHCWGFLHLLGASWWLSWGPHRTCISAWRLPVWPASGELADETAVTYWHHPRGLQAPPGVWVAWLSSETLLVHGSRPGPQLEAVPIRQVEPGHHPFEAICACIPVSMETVTSLRTESPQEAPHT